MSIFGREEPQTSNSPSQPTTPRPAEPQPQAQATQISAGTTISGEITGKTEVRIEGTVEGRLIVEKPGERGR